MTTTETTQTQPVRYDVRVQMRGDRGEWFTARRWAGLREEEAALDLAVTAAGTEAQRSGIRVVVRSYTTRQRPPQFLPELDDWTHVRTIYSADSDVAVFARLRELAAA